MAEEYTMDAGGSGNTGQTTIGPNSRKLSQGEAGFRENNGVAGLRCGDCLFFEASECRIVDGRIDEDDVCDQFEPNLKDGKMYAEQGTKVAVASSAPSMGGFDMWIYRVAEKDGIRRWYSTSSGTKVDLYGEKMSTRLFEDFVKRIDNSETEIPVQFTSDAWKGGLPYLGVAHYLDLDGFGIVGKADSVWRDGKVLKMRGTFDDNPLAIAAFDAIQADRLEKRADTERVRVSIAFIDWGHNHGKGRAFTRKSLGDACPYCEAGLGEKEYTAGQLVHLALTRRPAYPETEIVALEERSMSKRRDDAESIIGKELADELEAKSKELIGRSTDGPAVAAGAIVIKDESGEMEDKAPSAGDERALGGALNLDEAEAFISKSDGNSPTLLTPYELLTIVLTNIAEGDLEEKSTAIREVVADFQNTLDARTAEAVLRIEKALGGETVKEETESIVERQVPPQFREDEEEERKRKRRPEEEMADEESDDEMESEDEMSDEESDDEEGEGEEEYEEDEEEKKKMKEKSVSHPLNAALLQVRDAFDEAVEAPGDRAQKLSHVQESINDLGKEITVQVSEAAASAPVDAATIQRAVADAVAPLQASLAALQAQVAAGASVEKSSKVPLRRAIKMPTATFPTSQSVVQRSKEPTEENPTPKIRDLARKSTIGYEKRVRGG